MNHIKTTLVYFSPTESTKHVLHTMCKSMQTEKTEYDVTDGSANDLCLDFSQDELVVFGFPVYSGRVPSTFCQRIQHLKGNCTKAVIVATYGNRDYDDSILEMKHIAENKGFQVIGCAAVITEHSIVHSVAAGRPDAKDVSFIEQFAHTIQKKYESKEAYHNIVVKGKEPYRPFNNTPLTPVASKTCTACGLCAKKCPVGAIPFDTPEKTDEALCISCMRCVKICPNHARHVPKIKMLAVEHLLNKYQSIRKEPEMFV